MLGSGFISQAVFRLAIVGQAGRSQVDVFGDLYLAFVVLGTLVGTIVISYTVYNAYKYRVDDSQSDGEYDVNVEDFDDEPKDGEKAVARPKLGELPTGTGKGGGKKLFLSFSLSAILVLGLIIYSYSLLLYVEGSPLNGEDAENALEVDVVGYQFGWEYTYPNGHTTDTLQVPEDRVVALNVTSRDVFHNWGAPELRAKTDAIPGQTTSTWFEADETGEYQAVCYELCGRGHSNMRGDIIVMESQEYQDWYNGTGGSS